MNTGFRDECGHCGGWHSGACPRVKSIEYHRDGTVAKVEYHDPNPAPIVYVNSPLFKDESGEWDFLNPNNEIITY